VAKQQDEQTPMEAEILREVAEEMKEEQLKQRAPCEVEQTYHNEPEYCYSATIDEIEQKGWSLVPSKYIEFRNRDEQIDFDTRMRQLQTELRDLLQQEEQSKQELKDLFEKLGYEI